MSCKKPVFLAIDGVSRELIETAKCEVSVEPENTKSIVEGVECLLKLSKEELIKMGESGYIYAKKYFDRELLAKEYVIKIQEKINA